MYKLCYFGIIETYTTFKRLGFKALAAGLVLKLVVFAQKCLAE